MGRWLLASLVGLWGCGGSIAPPAGDASSDVASDAAPDVVADAGVQDVVQPRMGCASQVAAGTENTCAIDLAGALWCWGSNALGQLGIGVAGGAACGGDGCVMSPVRVVALGTGVAKVSVGRYHSCAVKQDGTAWCWGWNQNGQIGDGTTTDRALPVQVTGLTGVVAISASVLDTCAVEGDGSVWCWGWNGAGQLGDGTTIDRHSPVQVASMASATEVAVGHRFACARKKDGSGWCWGHNVWGELGNGTTSPIEPPGPVTALANGVLGMTASVEGDYACAADALLGRLYCWGLAAPGLPIDAGGIVDTPTEVQGLASVIGLAAGTSTTCALRSDATVWCVGAGFGSDGGVVITAAPAPVAGLPPDVVGVAAGSGHDCALTKSGIILCWGNDSFGQLGTGTPSSTTCGIPCEINPVPVDATCM